MRTRFIKDLQKGDAVTLDFGVLDKSTPTKYKNKPGTWFSMSVSDKTGEISVKYWGGPDEETTNEVHNSFVIGDIISIRGMVQYDNYAKGLVISVDAKSGQTIQKSDSFDLTDFLPVTEKDIDEMKSKLCTIISEIQNSDIQRLLKSFFDDPIFMERYSKSPAASTYHHSYVGGLIEHVLNMIELAKIVSKQYEDGLDLDLIIAGCILHDIGKIEELEAKTVIKYTTTGELLGHITIGAQMVQTKIDSFEGFNELTKNKILHMILSHHGTKEFGSPVEPRFPEAVALNKIDECDSQIKKVLQHKEKSSNSEEEFVYVNKFGRLYLK